MKLVDIQAEIRRLCIERYEAPGDFIEFTDKLMSLGVIRQTYDVINDDLVFYSKDKLLYHLSAAEINKAISVDACNFAESLNLHHLKTAIANIDSRKISAVEFHQEVAKAGIVNVSVYLKQRKIYYLSQDGEYYLEVY